MRVAQIVGTVTLNEHLPEFTGARLRLAIPFTAEELAEGVPERADTVVVWDELAAGIGSWIALSEGPEAAQPFRPDIKPVDAYNAAILDTVDVEIEREQQNG